MFVWSWWIDFMLFFLKSSDSVCASSHIGCDDHWLLFFAFRYTALLIALFCYPVFFKPWVDVFIFFIWVYVTLLHLDLYEIVVCLILFLWQWCQKKKQLSLTLFHMHFESQSAIFIVKNCWINTFTILNITVKKTNNIAGVLWIFAYVNADYSDIFTWIRIRN